MPAVPRMRIINRSSSLSCHRTYWYDLMSLTCLFQPSFQGTSSPLLWFRMFLKRYFKYHFKADLQRPASIIQCWNVTVVLIAADTRSNQRFDGCEQIKIDYLQLALKDRENKHDRVEADCGRLGRRHPPGCSAAVILCAVAPTSMEIWAIQMMIQMIYWARAPSRPPRHVWVTQTNKQTNRPGGARLAFRSLKDANSDVNLCSRR